LFPELHPDHFTAERQNMVATQLRGRGIRDERLLTAMARVPRHEFVEAHYRDQAYEDHPLPIGAGQTVSQPYIVALMLELLHLEASSKVLEIGTGSGYQTALLAELAAHVYSVERHAELAHQAQEQLSRLGFTNVSVLVGDGSQGLAEYAPFDAIVVSAAASEIPAPLFEQLQEGGRMIIPVGPPEQQELQLVRKQQGRPLITVLEGCRFVPLISDEQIPRLSWNRSEPDRS
jgi:protein-L-isoaspartate(D-aspartate) O-methyltransferase